MNSFLDINEIAFSLWGYGVSHVELIGTVFGLVSVMLAAKGNILTWPTGIINEAAFFIMFYQVQLYSDMYLQVYFFAVTLYGWYFWNGKKTGEVLQLSTKWRLLIPVLVIVASVVTGYMMSRIHEFLPHVFHQPAAFPYWDAVTTVSSIVATILLSRKLIETWILWIIVDVVSIMIYLSKGIHLVAIEYFVFLVICVAGFVNWGRKL